MQPITDWRGYLIRASGLSATLLFCFAGLTPLLTFLVPNRTDHDVSRFVEVIILDVIALASAFGWRRSIHLQYSRTTAGILVALILLAIASTALHAGDYPARELILLCLLIGTTLTVATYIRDSGIAIFLQAVVLISGSYLMLVMFIFTAALLNGNELVISELFPGYTNLRFFNHVQTVQIPLLNLAAINPQLRSPYRLGARIGGVLSFALVFASSGRATLVALLLSLVVVQLWARWDQFKWRDEVIKQLMIGLVIYYLVFVFLPSLSKFEISSSEDMRFSRIESSQARIYLWKLACYDIVGAPIFGIGPMGFASRVNAEAAHPHNIYLQVAAEWGIPFFLLSCWLIRRAFGAMRERTSQNENANFRCVGVALIATFTAILSDGLLSGNFVMPMSQVWIACAFGLMIGFFQNESDKNRVPFALNKIVFGRFWVWGLIFFAGFSLVVKAERDFVNLNTRLERVRAVAPTPRDGPRFWSDGWFGRGPESLPDQLAEEGFR